MSRIIASLFCLLALGQISTELNAQSSFDPNIYKSHLEANRNLSAADLLGRNPAPYTYYSDRLHKPDLRSIPWYDSIDRVLSLTADEEALLEQNFFMVTERNATDSWTNSLINLYNNDLPLFLSSDYILHSLHRSYDEILLTIEWQLLESNLQDLLEAMYSALPLLESKYKSDARLDVNIDDVDLYISVARSLLEEAEFAPQSQDKEGFLNILALVDAEQMASIELFTDQRQRKIDFSQFTPRGHYTKEFWTSGGPRTLENYFRSMMWLGRIDFMLTPPPRHPAEPAWTEDELRRMQISSILLNELLEISGKKDNLLLHEEIITYMVGEDDNLTPVELSHLTAQTLSSPLDLFNTEVYLKFSDSLNASDDYGQKIMSDWFTVNPYTSEPDPLPVSFRLLGQKFLIDSYVLSEVVYDRIISEGTKVWRPLPDPLDLMAVMGNMDAMSLLSEDLEEFKYSYKIDALKYLVDTYDPGFWEQSLYNTWLGGIRDLNPEAAYGLPYFMQTTAWHHKTLNTQLCSWAELRHDNLLYAKQSYTGGTACSFPYTYVEPYPDLYRRLNTFARNAASFFRGMGVEFNSRNRIVSFYENYAGLMEKLAGIADKELSGTGLSDEEISFLKTMINSFMMSGPVVEGWILQLFFNEYDGLEADFVVADVHTQPTDFGGTPVGKVLHVGNGLVNTGVFLAPNPTNPEQTMAFAGPVSSFHYEITRNFDRLTDERWEEKFWSGELPPRPDWAGEYLADKDGNTAVPVRKLKGSVYGGTFTDPASVMNPMDYLLAFPNPASEEFHLRFVLNRKSDIQADIYSLEGRYIVNAFIGILTEGEHDIPVNTNNWTSGVYIVKFQAGDRIHSRKVLIKSSASR